MRAWTAAMGWAVFYHISFHVSNGLILLLTSTERLSLIRQQRAEAAKKREEEKAGNIPRT